MDIGRLYQAYLDDLSDGRSSRLDNQYPDILQKLLDEYDNPSGDGDEILIAITDVIHDQMINHGMRPIDALSAAAAAVQTLRSHDGFGLSDEVEVDDESFTNIDEDEVRHTEIADLSPEELAARAIFTVNDIEAAVAAEGAGGGVPDGGPAPGGEAGEAEEEMQHEEEREEEDGGGEE